MLSPGYVVAQKYRIERLLGSGGMGAVYVATNLVLEKPVALKVMSTSLLSQHDWVQRFFREGVAASKARHPGVVQVFDAGVHEGAPWMAMELLEGESLRERLTRGRLAVSEAHAIARQVLAALSAVHAVGIVHRDLKPDNIFLERSAEGVRAKVLDFGIAKDAEGISSLTGTGIVVGTAHYLAPEQARDARVVDARTDIYAMGVVLFECLSGQMPYDASTVPELIVKMHTEEPRNLGSLAPDVPPSVAHVVHACLAREPQARPQSAQAMSEALDHAMSHGSPIPVTRHETGPGGLHPAWQQIHLPSYASPAPIHPGSYASPAPFAGPAPTMPMPHRPARSGWGCGWIIGVLAVLGILVAVLIVGVFALGRWVRSQVPGGGRGGGVSWGPHGVERTLWDSSHTVMVGDVNNDGHDDIVGSINQLSGSELTSYLTAHDGRDGRRIWTSEALGNLDSRANTHCAVAGRMLLYATSAGMLQGYDLATGRKRWDSSLGERVDHFCGGDGTTVVVVLSDRRRMVATLADGSVRAAPATEECAPISTDEFPGEGISTTWARIDPHGFRWPGREQETVEIEGMQISFAARSPTTNRVVALGQREVGTRVPMIAVAGEGGWRQDIPAMNPLSAEDDEPENAALHGERAFVVYEMTNEAPAHLTAFDLSTGRRLFDRELPHNRMGPNRGGTLASDDLLLVEQGATLYAIDPRDGRERFTIGTSD